MHCPPPRPLRFQAKQCRPLIVCVKQWRAGVWVIIKVEGGTAVVVIAVVVALITREIIHHGEMFTKSLTWVGDDGGPMTTARSTAAISVDDNNAKAASAVAGDNDKAKYRRAAPTALAWMSRCKGHALPAAVKCIGGGMVGAIVQNDACSGTRSREGHHLCQVDPPRARSSVFVGPKV